MSKVVISVALSAVMIVAAFFAYTYMMGKSDAEQQAKFVERYNSIEREKQADFTRHLTATLANADVKTAVLNSARPVSVDLVFRTTLKEMFEEFKIDETLNAKRTQDEKQAAEKEGREPAELKPLTIDEIYASSQTQAEAIGQLPSQVKDAMKLFVDGTVEVDLSGFGFSAPPNPGWFLGSDYIGVSPQGYSQVCNNVPINEAGKYIVTFTLHADSEREDAWKKEVLFSGTAKELCSNGSNYPKYYEEQGVVVFKRPAVTLLPTPSSLSALGTSEDLKPGDKLYFPRITETGGMKVGIGFFEGVRKFRLKTEIIEFNNSAFSSATDVGAPVYYVSGNNQIKLLGFLLPDRTVVSADFVLTGLAE